MATGDHIRVWRGFYWHHGIDAGDGTVIHASGEPGRMKLDARVRRDPREWFARGGDVEVVTSPGCGDRRATVKRAERALGDESYSLLFNNCEHFAQSCVSGRYASAQVDGAAVTAAAIGLAARVAVGAALRRGGAAAAAGLLPAAGPLMTGIAITGATLAVASVINRAWSSEG